MTQTPSPRRARPILTALTALTLAAPAMANVMTVDALTLFRDGTATQWLAGQNLLLNDSFDNNLPLAGPSFTGGNDSNYSVQGLAGPAQLPLAVREQGGQMLLDPTQATVSAGAAGALGHSLRVRLETNVSDSVNGLAESRTFAAAAQISLASLPALNGTFGLRLNDSFSNQNDAIELYLTQTSTGLKVVFRRQDFLADTVTIVGISSVLTPTPGASDIALILAHPTADNPDIYAGWAYTDGQGTLLSRISTFSTPLAAYHGESNTWLELRATQDVSPVPEPTTAALLALGLGALGWRARRRG